ncbi:DNA adenine methylase [Avibacterium volantium]|uniref:DNA adenine methylase n=3 Tax=Avibacterium volantium TaxID=762 RepID=UPI003BF88C4A
MKAEYIKSPMNYMGGKFKLLKQITPLFPKGIDTFVDLFAGGVNVGINVPSKKLIINDNLTYLIELYRYFKLNSKQYILEYIEKRILEFDLSKENQEGYLRLRKEYNNKKRPLDLFVLTAYSFNHQIRFNNSHEFNTPFGKNRSSYNEKMRGNLISFIDSLHKKEVEIYNLSFESFNYEILSYDDLVYCDPPYLVTTGTYNDGRRGFKGWGEKEDIELLNILDNLNERNIKFSLSNVLEHKGKSNYILKDWLLKNKNKYKIHDLCFNYNNSSYNIKRNEVFITREVLITNY